MSFDVSSQATRSGGLIFTALQTAGDPFTGVLVGRDAAAQAHRALCNLQAILESASSSLAGALRVTVYLTDLADLAAIDHIYADFFPVDAPARSIVEVRGLPGGAMVGIEAIAAQH